MKKKIRKIIERFDGGSRNIPIKDARTLLKEYGFEYDHHTGSHEIWYNDEIGKSFPIVEKDGGQIKRAYIDSLIKLIEDHYDEKLL